MKKTFLLISLLVLVLSMLVACGGGAEEAPAPAAASRQPLNHPRQPPCLWATLPKARRPSPLAPAVMVRSQGLPGLGKDMTTSASSRARPTNN